MSTAFIIGNGLSRKSIDLTKLNGTTYGSNAIYREFTPDYLCSVDTRMIYEIHKSGFLENYNNFMIMAQYYRYFLKLNKQKNKNYTPYVLNFFPPRKRLLGERSRVFDSGITSLIAAASIHKHTNIYLLGMDFNGVSPDTKEKNNIYRGTENYDEHKVMHRVKFADRYLTEVLAHYKNTLNIIRVVDINSSPLNYNYSNFQEITVEEFKKDHDC